MFDKLIQLSGSATRSVVDLSKKVASKSIPAVARVSTEFAKGYTSKDWKPSVVMPRAKPTSSEESGDVGVCNICTGPYVDGQCLEYKCWK
jgi:hypothetical protein